MDPQAQFCPNMDCYARGKKGRGNIVIHSRKKKRYQCKECKRTFSEKKGTVYYRLQHHAELVTIVVTLLAFGCPVPAIVQAYGLDKRTVLAWGRKSGEHSQAVHEHLVQKPRDLQHVQADEVYVKAQGKRLWMAMAIMVSTRLWLGGVIDEKRNHKMIRQLLEMVHASARLRPLLICVDGLQQYIGAVRKVFRVQMPKYSPAGRPRLIPWQDICLGRMIKQYEGKRVIGVVREMAIGSHEAAIKLIETSRGGTDINTAFIERINATFRARLDYLTRRSRTIVRRPESLGPLMYLIGTVYNFCTSHKSLRLPGVVGGHKWIPRSPALAAGITDHFWSVNELLTFKLPLPAWRPKKRPGYLSRRERELIALWGD